MKQTRLRSGDQGRKTQAQHTKPCPDCPWSRSALRGWLGDMTADEWLQCAHGESHVMCHCHTNQQCAGLAIYRRNVCKIPRPPNLVLPADRSTVFASRAEFAEHHKHKAL